MEKLRAARDAEYSFKPTLNDKTNAIAYRSSVASLAAQKLVVVTAFAVAAASVLSRTLSGRRKPP